MFAHVFSMTPIFYATCLFAPSCGSHVSSSGVNLALTCCSSSALQDDRLLAWARSHHNTYLQLTKKRTKQVHISRTPTNQSNSNTNTTSNHHALHHSKTSTPFHGSPSVGDTAQFQGNGKSFLRCTLGWHRVLPLHACVVKHRIKAIGMHAVHKQHQRQKQRLLQ